MRTGWGTSPRTVRSARQRAPADRTPRGRTGRSRGRLRGARHASGSAAGRPPPGRRPSVSTTRASSHAFNSAPWYSTRCPKRTYRGPVPWLAPVRQRPARGDHAERRIVGAVVAVRVETVKRHRGISRSIPHYARTALGEGRDNLPGIFPTGRRLHVCAARAVVRAPRRLDRAVADVDIMMSGQRHSHHLAGRRVPVRFFSMPS